MQKAREGKRVERRRFHRITGDLLIASAKVKGLQSRGDFICFVSRPPNDPFTPLFFFPRLSHPQTKLHTFFHPPHLLFPGFSRWFYWIGIYREYTLLLSCLPRPPFFIFRRGMANVSYTSGYLQTFMKLENYITFIWNLLGAIKFSRGTYKVVFFLLFCSIWKFLLLLRPPLRAL